jgi:hypothetical protein
VESGYGLPPSTSAVVRPRPKAIVVDKLQLAHARRIEHQAAAGQEALRQKNERNSNRSKSDGNPKNK